MPCYYVCLSSTSADLPKDICWSVLKDRIQHYRLGQWSIYGEALSSSRNIKWVMVQPEWIAQSWNVIDSSCKVAKFNAYFQSVLEQISNVYGIYVVKAQGDLHKTQQQIAKFIQLNQRIKQSVADATNLNKQQVKMIYKNIGGSSESLLRKMAVESEGWGPDEPLRKVSSKQGSSAGTDQTDRLLEKLVLVEILRRNSISYSTRDSKNTLPISVQIGKYQTRSELLKFKSPVQPYKGPAVKFILSSADGGHNIDTEEASQYINTFEVQRQAFQLWCSLSYYARLASLEIISIKAPINLSSLLVLGNLECQYTKNGEKCESSSANRLIYICLYERPFYIEEMEEWETCSSKLIAQELLDTNQSGGMNPKYYQILSKIASYKLENNQVLCHFSYDGCKVLTRQKGGLQPINMNIKEALQKVCLFDDIMVSDLSDKERSQKNRKVIRQIGKEYYVYTSGGIDSVADIQDLLSNSIRKVMLDYPLDSKMVTNVEQTRLLVRIRLNKHNQVIGNNSLLPLKDVINELVSQGLGYAIFVTPEYQLSGKQNLLRLSRLLMSKMIHTSRVYLECDIKTVEELKCLWRFSKLIPVLGGILWQDEQFTAQVFSEMPEYDSFGQVECVILGTSGILKGHSKLNRKAIWQTCRTRQVNVSLSEGIHILPKQGELNSIKKISMSCSGNSVLFVVDSANNFCGRFNRASCYRNQSIVKTNLSVINEHIRGKINSKSYSGVMQNNPGLALAKIMEEFWEIICASSNEQQTNECSDFLVHFFMYINGKGVKLEDIINELNARAYAPQLIPKFSKTIRDPTIVSLGILSQKYFKSPDIFILEELGIKIIRPTAPRKLLIDYTIEDQHKYDRFFKDKRVSFLPMKSKDMPWLIAFGAIDGCITYSPVMDNYPNVSSCIHKRQVFGLRIALIKRKDDIIDPKLWNKNNKAIIACEHVNYVHEFFVSQGIDENAFTLSRIVGSSESYLIAKNNVHFCLCDAVVETGLTLEANDLEEWCTVKKDGDISIGLFLSLKYKS